VAKKKGAPGLTDLLRQAIRESGRTLKHLSEASGVDAGRLSRFVRGERDMYLSAADKLCRALGLTLPPAHPRKGKSSDT
jgi:plasmid maintenance system antidote protein VapI